MKRWQSRLALLAAAAALPLAIPAFGQQAGEQESPESLLPPGFGDPAAPLPPPQAPTAASPSGAPAAAPGSAPGPAPAIRIPSGESISIDALSEAELAALEAALPKPIEIPDFARRPTDFVGALNAASGGFATDAWGGVNGRFLSTLMRLVDAPLPSRWTSMLLRRALLSEVPTPAYVNPVDWVAERAWLLVRMGEADAARMLVQAVDVDQFTPKMFQVAVQTALATSDPAALCPLVGPGRETSDEAVWPLADAMCAGLRGDAAQATALIDQTRRRGSLDAVDVELAEKIVGAGANSRRAVTVQWEDVATINSWRFGLASAAGLEIPAPLMSRAGAHVQAWHARAPMVPLDQRLAGADAAASLGVFSNQSLVGIYSLLADTTDPSELGESVGGRLRVAYVGRTLNDRLGALRSLWSDAKTPVQRHARRILTAVAASRIRPNASVGGEADDFVASMLSAGLDAPAARWMPVVADMEGEAAERAWAMLAVGTTAEGAGITDQRVRGYGEAIDSEHAGRMLLASLAGLGRIEGAAAMQLGDEMGVRLSAQSRWSRALDRAGRQRQPATVMLLAAAGMQTGGWAGVPPEHLYHILRALRAVGMDYEARMVAAEAIARL